MFLSLLSSVSCLSLKLSLIAFVSPYSQTFLYSSIFAVDRRCIGLYGLLPILSTAVITPNLIYPHCLLRFSVSEHPCSERRYQPGCCPDRRPAGCRTVRLTVDQLIKLMNEVTQTGALYFCSFITQCGWRPRLARQPVCVSVCVCVRVCK